MPSAGHPPDRPGNPGNSRRPVTDFGSDRGGTQRIRPATSRRRLDWLAAFVHLLVPLATHGGLLHDVRVQAASCLMHRRLEYSGLVTSRLLS